MKLLETLKSQHDECNELTKNLLKRDLEKKQKDLAELGLEASKSILIRLSKTLQKLKELEDSEVL